MDPLRIETTGLPQLAKFMHDLPAEVSMAAVKTINKTADRSRTDIAQTIMGELNFKASYLAPSEKRLYVRQYARTDAMSAIVTGRDRPTSLARFVNGSPTPSARGGVTVQVKKGVSKFMPNAFIIRLRRGATMDGDDVNYGLAVRLKPGESLTNKKQAIKMKNGLYLLYGPSIGQAMRALFKEGERCIPIQRAQRVAEEEFDRFMGML